MSEFLEDPSVLTKDKLKSALQANNVSLPNGEQKKDVYVQLYLKNLTAQNKKKSAPPEAFSSDEELPAPVVSNRSRSGRKATRKTDKPLPTEVDVMELSDEDLREQLQKYGVGIGPIVASTRKLYERKLQKLLDEGPPEALAPPAAPPETDGSQNGNAESDHYSDKEEETAVPEPEPEPEPAPAPVVERPLRSRGKIPVTTRTRSSQHNRHVELLEEELQLMDEEEEEEPVLNIKRRYRRASSMLEQAMISSDDIDVPDNSPSQVGTRDPKFLSEPMGRTSKAPPVESYTMDSTKPRKPAQNGAFQQVKDPQTFQPSAWNENIHQDSLSSSWQKEKAIPPDPNPSGLAIKPSKPPFFAVAIEGSQHSSASSFTSSVTNVGSGPPDSSSPLFTRQGSASVQPKQRKPVSQTIEQVEKVSAVEHTPKADAKDVLKEMFPNDVNTPTGISATCRRPIRGAAARSGVSTDTWLDDTRLRLTELRETSFSSTSSSNYVESRPSTRLLLSPVPSAFSAPRHASAPTVRAPIGGQSRRQRWMPVWVQVLVFGVLAGFLFLVYQAMETNESNPFGFLTQQTEDAPEGQTSK
ncbi:thymopoietin a isoform X2 [Clupea harengus]|uniref:Thymopoietin a isoform X2 n=1 Tax=Clupea harengus TaxID=7950 RepID=A0A6P8GSK8_CLUHA|nr:thymopoietin a isoform X2 [Clupea harengus]